jgi:hypothetical protein
MTEKIQKNYLKWPKITKNDQKMTQKYNLIENLLIILKRILICITLWTRYSFKSVLIFTLKIKQYLFNLKLNAFNTIFPSC